MARGPDSAVTRGPCSGEQWGIAEGCLDDDGVHSRAVAADSRILPIFSQRLIMVFNLCPWRILRKHSSSDL